MKRLALWLGYVPKTEVTKMEGAIKRFRKMKDRVIELEASSAKLIRDNRTLKSAVTAIAQTDGRVSHDELVQLGVAHLLSFDAEDNPIEVDEGPRAMLIAGDNQQATTAKFRQLKNHFIQHRKSVALLLDRLDKLSTSNAMGAEVAEIAAIRAELRAVLGQNI